MILRPKSRAEEIALFRSELVGALARRELPRGELKRELEALSQVRFRVPGSACTRSYSVPTLQRWYYAYRTGGLGALHPQPRQDRGHGRALSAAARDGICAFQALTSTWAWLMVWSLHGIATRSIGGGRPTGAGPADLFGDLALSSDLPHPPRQPPRPAPSSMPDVQAA